MYCFNISSTWIPPSVFILLWDHCQNQLPASEHPVYITFILNIAIHGIAYHFNTARGYIEGIIIIANGLLLLQIPLVHMYSQIR